MSQKVMKLIDPLTGLVECKVCGATKYISFVSKPFSSKSRFPRGSWQCINECNLEPDLPGNKTYHEAGKRYSKIMNNELKK